MKRTIRRLNKDLEDPVFRQGWVSNMVQCNNDAEDSYKKALNKTRINREDRRCIAVNAANRFIDLLKG